MKKLLLILLFVIPLSAQESSIKVKDAVNPPIPDYDEADRLLLKGIAALNTQADAACKALDQMKNLDQQYKEVKVLLEKKYKGFQLEGFNLVPVKDKK